MLKRTEVTSSNVDVHHRSGVFLHGTLQRIHFLLQGGSADSFSASPFLPEAYACILFGGSSMTKKALLESIFVCFAM